MTEAAQHFEEWAILELMGHRRLAGQVVEITIGGKGFIRIDVPGNENDKMQSQIYSPDAVYCITPTTEEIARHVAEQCHEKPISRWDVKDLLPAHEDAEHEEIDDEDVE